MSYLRGEDSTCPSGHDMTGRRVACHSCWGMPQIFGYKCPGCGSKGYVLQSCPECEGERWLAWAQSPARTTNPSMATVSGHQERQRKPGEAGVDAVGNAVGIALVAVGAFVAAMVTLWIPVEVMRVLGEPSSTGATIATWLLLIVLTILYSRLFLRKV